MHETILEPDLAVIDPHHHLWDRPVDRWAAGYPVLWNAFKQLATGTSAAEKRDLFGVTAARVYGLEHLLAG